ncbi:MAG: hypothetical protein K2R98_09170 [Gemmataceae bacterium]|nr:hypothetical protein [Gemmataceae bacterium]
MSDSDRNEAKARSGYARAVNAPKLTADALQHLMQHKSYTTTQQYINMSKQVDDAVAVLHVPEVLRAAT